MTQAIKEETKHRRATDSISQITHVSLGFVLSLLTIGASAAWAGFTYFDNRMNTVEQAVYRMSGDVHQIAGEMTILVDEKTAKR